MEFRRVGDQDFMSKERDLNVWFQGAVRAALTATENSIPNMTQEKAVEMFQGLIENLRDFYRAAMTEDVEPDVLAKRLWEGITTTDTGKVFLMRFAMCVFTMYVDFVRRAVQKPGVSKTEIENSLKAVSLLSKLPLDLANQVRPFLKVAEGFASFEPGMYTTETEENEECPNNQ